MGPTVPYLAAAAAATVTGAVHRRRAAEITKPLPLLVLAVHSARGARRRGGVDNALLAGALAFSAAGDRAMLLEEFTDEPSDKDRRLQIGASLFACAQLCLTGVMWRRGARPRPAGLLLRTAILAESATVMALRRPRLLPVLGGYGNTLALMSSTAGAAERPQPRLRTGGWLFLASDLTIINRRHLIGDKRLAAVAEAWVLASYFAAQWLLMTSLSESDG
ncbi:lysoplasmalogenase [Streptomyces sp. SID6673]|nr:lysoplasmalogenase [Streptomyces sp. SID11726]NEB25391.1 lysoplasmalogenase [Streptomyces sp. SID6673]